MCKKVKDGKSICLKKCLDYIKKKSGKEFNTDDFDSIDYRSITSSKDIKSMAKKLYKQCHNYKRNMVLAEKNNQGMDTDYYCVCGKQLMYPYLVFEKDKPEKYYMIGSTCITGLFPKKSSVYQRTMLIKCDKCDVVLKRGSYVAHCKSGKHKENKEMSKDHQKCLDCKDWIQKSAFKNRCYDCYMVKKTGKKKCSSCNKYKIKENTTFYYCYDCYKEHTKI